MKSNKLIVASFLAMSLFTNSCATFMTSRQEERKTGDILEFDRKLLKSEFDPKIEVIENDLKVTLSNDNKYDLKQKIYEKGGKDFQWRWLFGDFFIGTGIGLGIGFGLFNDPSWGTFGGGTATKGFIIGNLIGWSYFIGSWIWSASMDKSKEEKKVDVRNEIMPNTNFSIKIGRETLNDKTDERGISFLKDIKLDKKDLMFGDADLIVNSNNGEKFNQKIDIKTFSDLAYSQSIKEINIELKNNDSISPQIATIQKNDSEKTISKASIKIKGKYYALLIGINNYKTLDKLKTAVKDAKEIEKVLKSSYGFETKLITDEKATRKNIIVELNNFVKKLSSDDKLLIYYAGHGYFDKESDKSYWLPVDASTNEESEWIMSDSITSNLKKISSKQILVVSDSCYSGTLSRGIMMTNYKSENDRINYLNNLMSKDARLLISSGGNEPVTDGGGGGHSVFAKVFIDSLKGIKKNYFTAEELFTGYIKEKVAGKSDQTPQFNIIRNSGHDDGDFIFIKK